MEFDSPIIRVSHIYKSYGKVKALKNFSLKVNLGQVVGILGPNGSGKTSALSLMLGVTMPNDGEVSWSIAERRREVGAMLSPVRFIPNLSLKDNLAIVAKLKGVAENKFESTLGLVDLADRLNNKFSSLTPGLRQRFGFAAALVGNPRVLLLDEPTNALDPEAASDVRNLIVKLHSEGMTIVMTSNILSEIDQLCSHVAVLKRGRRIAYGTKEDVFWSQDRYLISASDATLLFSIFKSCPLIKAHEEVDNALLVTLADTMSPSDLNQYAFEHGITLSRLEQQRTSFESKFINLMKEEVLK
jgi:ABC-type multidrug transport system, ATPase component